MYLRCNWQSNTEFKVSQSITSTPKGTYRLTCKVANSTSNYYATNYRLSLSDGTNTAINNFFYSKSAWGEMSVVFYKSDDASNLNIEAYMKPGAQGSSQHYCLLLDDFKLEYLSDNELEKASEENLIDLTSAISNPSIYNEARAQLPWGWKELAHTAGNGNRTEKEGDTRLEGWSGGAMNVDYCQTLTNLPNGKYIVKAKVYDSNDKGAYLYATSGATTITADMSNTEEVLATEAVLVANNTVTFGIKAEVSSGTWMTGDDFQIFYAGIDLDALITAYANLQNKAMGLLESSEYEIVTGTERTNLSTTKDVIPEETKSGLETAISNLQAAISTFTSAKPAYQTLVDAKNAENPTLAYASEESLNNLNAAKAVEMSTITSKEDAATKTEAITIALRAYYESHALAEGVEGAENCTDKVVNADFTDGANGWNSSQGGGGTKSNEPWTNADGSTGGSYYDYWNGTANNQKASQVVNGLNAGKYIVTVKARAQDNFWLYLRINDNDETSVDIDEMGSSIDAGLFGRGWNDYTAEFTVNKAGSVKIEVGNFKPSGIDNRAGWFSFGDVRLIKIGELDAVTLDENIENTITAGDVNITLKRTITADKWNTLVLPFNLTNEEVIEKFGEGTQVAAFSNIEGENVDFTTTEGIKANVPVMIKTVAEFTGGTFDGYTLVEGTPEATGTNYSFVGCYEPTMLADGEYLLKDNMWWKKEATDKYGVKGFRAFLRANNTETAAKTLSLVIDGETTGVKLNTVTGEIEGETYNISGQKVTDSYKGIVIKNGKKVVRK